MKAAYILFTILTLSLMTHTGCSPKLKQTWTRAGYVKSDGSLLFSDPLYIDDTSDALNIKVDVKPGFYTVEILISNMGNGDRRVAQARLMFNTSAFNQKLTLGRIAVDSGIVTVLDPNYLDTEWTEVGPLRKGSIIGSERDKIADLLKKNGFEIGGINQWSISLSKPVSEDDEKRIETLIDNSMLNGFLMITTDSSYDRILEQMEGDSLSASLQFSDNNDGFLIAFSSGFGDGEYPVYGLYDKNELVGILVDFEID